MLKGLRRRMMLIATISSVVILVVTAVIMHAITLGYANSSLDAIADTVCEMAVDGGADGDILDSINTYRDKINRIGIPYDDESQPTELIRASFDKDGNLKGFVTDSRNRIVDQRVKELCSACMESPADRGWVGDYRFKKCCLHGDDTTILLVDGTATKAAFYRIFFVVMGLVFFLIVVFHVILHTTIRYAAKPLEESYERQKRFISNASHELKTPLTLIMTDADLAEMDYGPNEWISEIKSEARDMSELITQMVVLSHMDEGARVLNLEPVNVSQIALDAVESWRGKAESRNLNIGGVIDTTVMCKTDAASVKQIFFVLMDNATKYCDEGGLISVDVTNKGRKHVCAYVENSYSKADKVDPQRLFERFYRFDDERADKIGHGIGLALAKETAENLGGALDVYTKEEPPVIGFKLVL